MSLHTFHLTKEHLEKDNIGSPAIISVQEAVKQIQSPVISDQESETQPLYSQPLHSPEIGISATSNSQSLKQVYNPSLSNKGRAVHSQETDFSQPLYTTTGNPSQPHYTTTDNPSQLHYITTDNPSQPHYMATNNPSQHHYTSTEKQRYKRVLHNEYDPVIMKYSKPEDNQIQDKVNHILSSIDNSYHHVDHGYVNYQDRGNIKSTYQDNTRNNQLISSLNDKVNMLEFENQKYQKTIADLQEKIKINAMQSNELIEKYQQRDSEMYQEFLDLKKSYDDTMQKVIHGGGIKSNDSGISKDQENEYKLMKALTAVDVLSQTKSDQGITYLCVLNVKSIHYKFQLYIGNDPEQQVDYMPKNLDELPIHAKTCLPAFLLEEISFSLDDLPTVFWRLTSSLDKAT